MTEPSWSLILEDVNPRNMVDPVPELESKNPTDEQRCLYPLISLIDSLCLAHLFGYHLLLISILDFYGFTQTQVVFNHFPIDSLSSSLELPGDQKEWVFQCSKEVFCVDFWGSLILPYCLS